MPFSLSPIPNSNRIKIEDDLFCDEEEENQYLKEKEKRRFLQK